MMTNYSSCKEKYEYVQTLAVRFKSITDAVPAIVDQLPTNPTSPFFIHVAGPSGAGKTTFSKFFLETHAATHFEMDNYLRGRKFVKKLLQEEPNSYGSDDIRAFDLETIAADLSLLKTEREIYTPVFDRQIGERGERSKHMIVSNSVPVVVEGLHALHPIVTTTSGMKIFVDASQHDRLWRRILRDTQRPDYDKFPLDDVINGFFKYVEPSYGQFKDTYLGNADFIVDNPMDSLHDLAPYQNMRTENPLSAVEGDETDLFLNANTNEGRAENIKVVRNENGLFIQFYSQGILIMQEMIGEESLRLLIQQY